MNTLLTPQILHREGFLPTMLQKKTVGFYNSEMKMFLQLNKDGYLQKEMDRTVRTLGELKELIKDRLNLNEVK
jgi:hypothetical protein